MEREVKTGMRCEQRAAQPVNKSYKERAANTGRSSKKRV